MLKEQMERSQLRNVDEAERVKTKAGQRFLFLTFNILFTDKQFSYCAVQTLLLGI